ncbi:MAG TPA: metalloregulator ArsR/SmtB family transcription factor [Humidesulfovibrio sp.]|uniref:ArsR/SmtB family transcription factor n=1 Tax=Humidesulfovibrio sp. TaxID=2910988 RepID=UPI002B706995|nr:metalloregulator ArsR/SmtB family transcription factor [Humidesulfovibrio sp.]HWR03773.1 metalloregulator ArsR/SmtB family transcription factor [Humidesulfovibrio sp.]
MDQLVRVMKALSDPGRVTILKLLGARELCACEIIRALKLAQPTISRHMKVLSDAGLVTGRKVGPWVHYRVAENPASPYARALLEKLSGWLEDDPALAKLKASLAADGPFGKNGKGGPCAAAPKEKELRP